jgi:hypothetical protein
VRRMGYAVAHVEDHSTPPCDRPAIATWSI